MPAMPCNAQVPKPSPGEIKFWSSTTVSKGASISSPSAPAAEASSHSSGELAEGQATVAATPVSPSQPAPAQAGCSIPAIPKPDADSSQKRTKQESKISDQPHAEAAKLDQADPKHSEPSNSADPPEANNAEDFKDADHPERKLPIPASRRKLPQTFYKSDAKEQPQPGDSTSGRDDAKGQPQPEHSTSGKQPEAGATEDAKEQPRPEGEDASSQPPPEHSTSGKQPEAEAGAREDSEEQPQPEGEDASSQPPPEHSTSAKQPEADATEDAEAQPQPEHSTSDKQPEAEAGAREDSEEQPQPEDSTSGDQPKAGAREDAQAQPQPEHSTSGKQPEAEAGAAEDAEEQPQPEDSTSGDQPKAGAREDAEAQPQPEHSTSGKQPEAEAGATEDAEEQPQPEDSTSGDQPKAGAREDAEAQPQPEHSTSGKQPEAEAGAREDAEEQPQPEDSTSGDQPKAGAREDAEAQPQPEHSTSGKQPEAEAGATEDAKEQPQPEDSTSQPELTQTAKRPRGNPMKVKVEPSKESSKESIASNPNTTASAEQVKSAVSVPKLPCGKAPVKVEPKQNTKRKAKVDEPTISLQMGQTSIKAERVKQEPTEDAFDKNTYQQIYSYAKQVAKAGFWLDLLDAVAASELHECNLGVIVPVKDKELEVKAVDQHLKEIFPNIQLCDNECLSLKKDCERTWLLLSCNADFDTAAQHNHWIPCVYRQQTTDEQYMALTLEARASVDRSIQQVQGKLKRALLSDDDDYTAEIESLEHERKRLLDLSIIHIQICVAPPIYNRIPIYVPSLAKPLQNPKLLPVPKANSESI